MDNIYRVSSVTEYITQLQDIQHNRQEAFADNNVYMNYLLHIIRDTAKEKSDRNSDFNIQISK